MTQALSPGLLSYASGRPPASFRNPGSMLEVAGVLLIVAALGFVGMESIQATFSYTSTGWHWTGWRGLSVHQWVMPFTDDGNKNALVRLGLIAGGFVLAISGYSIVRGRRSDEWIGFVLAVLAGSAAWLLLARLLWNTAMTFLHPTPLSPFVIFVHKFENVYIPILPALLLLLEFSLLTAAASMLGRRLLRTR